MRIPTWRLVLTGAAIVLLASAGIGLATAGTTAPSPSPDTTAGAPSDTSEIADREIGELEEQPGLRGRWALRAGRHLVHAEVTLLGRDDELINIWLDHGTVQSIDGGSLVIAEAGGTTRTVAIDEATRVSVGREEGDLGDVTVGAEVFVRSRVEDGAALARRIRVIPADR